MTDKNIRKRDCVKLANKIIGRCELPIPRIGSIDGIRSNLFTALLQVLYHRLPDGIIENPETTEDEVTNIQTLINHLALDLIHIDLSHISGADVIAGDPRAIYNLLEIFCGLHKYLSSTSIGKWNLEESLTETDSELTSAPSSDEAVPLADVAADPTEAQEGDEDAPPPSEDGDPSAPDPSEMDVEEPGEEDEGLPEAGDGAFAEGEEEEDAPAAVMSRASARASGSAVASRTGSRTSQPTTSITSAARPSVGSLPRARSSASAAKVPSSGSGVQRVGSTGSGVGRVGSSGSGVGKSASSASAGRRPSGDSAGRVQSSGSAGRVRSSSSAGAVPSGGSMTKVPSGGSAGGVPSTGSIPRIPSGTSATKVPSGTSAARVPSGSSAGRIPSGTSADRIPSGTSATRVPSGTSATRVPSGTSATRVPSGTSATRVPSGTSATRVPSGTSATRVPSGTSATRVPSGTSATRVPSGTSATRVPSGTSAIRVPSGTSATRVPSGTSATRVPSGTSAARIPSGSSLPPTGSSATRVPSGGSVTAARASGSGLVSGAGSAARVGSAGRISAGGSAARVSRSSSGPMPASSASAGDPEAPPSVLPSSESGPRATTSGTSAAGPGASGAAIRVSSEGVRPGSSRASARGSRMSATVVEQEDELPASDEADPSPPRVPSGVAFGGEFAGVGQASASRPSLGAARSSGIEVSGSLDHHHYHHYEDEEESEGETYEGSDEMQEDEEDNLWGPDDEQTDPPSEDTTQDEMTALVPEDDEEEEPTTDADITDVDDVIGASGDVTGAEFTADEDAVTAEEGELTADEGEEEEEEEEEDNDVDISRELEEEMERIRSSAAVSAAGSGTVALEQEAQEEASPVEERAGPGPQISRGSVSRARRFNTDTPQPSEEEDRTWGEDTTDTTMDRYREDTRGGTQSQTRAIISTAPSRSRRRCSSSSTSDPGVGYRRSGARIPPRNIETIAEIRECGGKHAIRETTREQAGKGLQKETVSRVIRRKVSSAPHPEAGYTKQSSRRSVCSDGVTDWLESQADDTYVGVQGQEADVFEYLRREFPYVHVSAETKRRLLSQYRKQMKYVISLVEPVESRKIKIRRRDVLKRQSLLTDIVRQQKVHDQRFRELTDQKRREIRVRNMPRDSKISCLRAQRYVSSFQTQFASRSAYNKSKEELLLRAVFEEMLEIQRSRLRMVRNLEKQAIQEFYDADGYTSELNKVHQFYEANFRELAQLLSRERTDLMHSEKQQRRLSDRIRREFRDYMEADVRSLNDKIVNSWQPQYRELDADRVRNDLYQANWKFCVT